MAACKQGFKLDGAGLSPLPPWRLASLLAVHSPIRPGLRARPAGLASGAASPELGLWAGTQTCRIRLQRLAHVSAREKSAREPTCVRQLLGAPRVSLWVCGAADTSQGPWETGTLRAALSLGGQATAGGALQLPFPPSDRVLTTGALGSVQPTSPKALPKDSWNLSTKERQEQRRRQKGASGISLVRVACSVQGSERKSRASLGKARPQKSSHAPGTLPDRASKQS